MNFTFALITPSYAPDFQRCQLLCWSIKRFMTTPVKHYIVVEKKDFKLFQQLADSNTVILTKEEILPSWIRRIPFFDQKNFWLNLRGFKSGNWFIRGWLIQQIVKLAAAQYVSEDVLIFVDSDVALIDSFDVGSLVVQEQVRLFRVEQPEDMDNEKGRKWKNTAKRLLGLPLGNNYYDYYVDQIVTWRRDNLIELYELIENNQNCNWMEALCGVSELSEYVLYGIFANYVLAENSGHYDDHLQKICQSYWEEFPMNEQSLKEFFQEAQSSGYKAVMISAKSSMNLSIEQFQDCLASHQPPALKAEMKPDEIKLERPYLVSSET
jgi:hypothetical protein